MTATKRPHWTRGLAVSAILLSPLVFVSGCGTGSYEAVLKETTERLARENHDRELLAEQQKKARENAQDDTPSLETQEEIEQALLEQVEIHKQSTDGGEEAPAGDADPANPNSADPNSAEAPAAPNGEPANP